MPYRSIEDLPSQVKVLPVEAQRLFLRVVNEALEQYKGDEEKAFAVAWSVVKKEWEKVDDKWVKKAGLQLTYFAAVTELKEEEGRHLATFYIINTSLNRINWRVTDKALEDALPTLLGKPLNCIPGYRVNHIYEPFQVGQWIGVEKPDGYAIAMAEVTDEVAWEKLKNKEWGPVSVVITVYRATCSKCGKDITSEPDEHVKSKEGHEIVESFVFKSVDFVSEPAYPQAGILALHIGQSGQGTILPALTASHAQSNKDGPQGAQGANPNPEEKREKRKMAEVEELRQKLANVETENRTLKADLDALKAERHMEKVNATVAARLEAGLVKDRAAETERLKALDDKTLDLLREDAGKVAEKVAKASTSTGPKTKYTADDKSTFEAAVEAKREELFGYKRDASGKVVS